MEIKNRYPWTEYIIASIVASIGAILIHTIQNDPPNFALAFMWLPYVWFLVLILMIFFVELLRERN